MAAARAGGGGVHMHSASDSAGSEPYMRSALASARSLRSAARRARAHSPRQGPAPPSSTSAEISHGVQRSRVVPRSRAVCGDEFERRRERREQRRHSRALLRHNNINLRKRKNNRCRVLV